MLPISSDIGRIVIQVEIFVRFSEFCCRFCVPAPHLLSIESLAKWQLIWTIMVVYYQLF